MRSYYELTKPRVTWLILMSTAIGFVFGARAGWTWITLFHCVFGTGLLASGTATLNQWYESTADALMKRTQARPIPSGKVSPNGALIFGLVLIILGFAELWIGNNRLTALLGLFTTASYLLAYTPLKQHSAHSTTIGAIPGAMPPMIGFAAASGTLTLEAWLLFAILFIWQFPHFYAIGWMYREDYQRAGIQTLSVVDPDGESTSRRIFLTCMALIPFSVLPGWLGMAGEFYIVGSVLIGFLFLYTCFSALEDLSRKRARNVLLASVVYLPVLYGLLLLDRGL